MTEGYLWTFRPLWAHSRSLRKLSRSSPWRCPFAPPGRWSSDHTNSLLKWVKSKGVLTDTVKREWVEKMVKDESIKACVRDVLKLRLDGGKSSTAKLNKFIGVAGLRDHRARGLLFYYGADTGRWAGSAHPATESTSW
jgi:hypothetical protein